MSINLDTPDDLKYNFYPVSNGYFSFKVRAANDAHVMLSPGSSDADPVVEIFLGGWGNSKSVIRKNKTKPERAEANTPNVLNAGEYRGFWVRWFDGVYTVGNEGEAAAFLSYQDPEPFPIQYAGVCTGWGATGSWIIDAPQPAPQAMGWQASSGGPIPIWVQASNGAIPEGAVPGGQDGSDIVYIARANHSGEIIPGKVVPSHGVAYIPWGGVENAFTDYEVLVGGHTQWVPTSGTQIPGNAFQGGESEGGEPLFIGRVSHDGAVTVGKVQPSHGVLYIPYGGAELSFPDYEILVQ